MKKYIFTIVLLLLCGCSYLPDDPPGRYTYIQHYDKNMRRTGYDKADNQTGIIYHYDVENNYLGFSEPFN